jgi:acyl-coenzyme A thioesterase PaaI-like protein
MHDMIKAQLGRTVPFATLTGVELLSIAPAGATARLVQRPEVSNHVATIHAGALFTLAEAASGAAMAGTFADQLQSIRPVVSDARIAYARPARGAIIAAATVAEPADHLFARFAKEGRVVFDIQVALTDEAGSEVATFSATWHLKKL